MSAIHEALKKAQKQKEADGPGTGSGVAARRRDRAWILRRVLFSSVVLAVCAGAAWGGWFVWEITRPKPKGQSAPMVRKAPTPVQAGGPAKAARLYGQAKALFRSGRTAEAEKAYARALQNDPGHVDALNNLGVIYLRQARYGEARECFEKAARLRPESADPHYNLACASVLQGRLAEALHHLKRAISCDTSALEWAESDQDLAALRKDPRFQLLIKGAKTSSP